MSATSPLDNTNLTGVASPAAVRSPRPPSIIRRVLTRPMGAVALLVLLIIIVACAAAPLIAPYGPDVTTTALPLKGPSIHHLLGTDELSRDILSRLLYGGRPMLLAAAEAMAIAITLGTVLGVVGGYRRGLTDRAISIWSDLMLAMPVLVVLIVVVSVYPHSLYPAMIPLGLMLSAAPTRVLRSVTLAMRDDLYIEAARVNGLSHAQIMIRHVVPRIRGAIVVQATLVGAVAVLLASGLAFLGFGVTVPAPTWGTMVAEAATQYQQQPWFLVPTGGIITITVLSLGLLGDVVRDAVAEQWTGMRPRARRPWGAARRARAAAPAGVSAHLASGAEVRDYAPAVPESLAPGLAQPTAGEPTVGSVLSVRDLRVSAPGPGGDQLVLVEGMSFDLIRGRTLTIVGESGCGKSVTARALLGVIPAGGQVAGSVRFGTEELVGASNGRLRAVRGRRIGFIGQEPTAGLDPNQPVGAALMEVVRAYRGGSRRAARERMLMLLRRVQIPDPERVAKLYPHEISGGMAQRVTIARALAGEPEVIIADEPTTALDVTVQAEILALLRALQLETGIAVLLITHDWGVVAGLADDIIVMYAGQAVETDEAGGVFHRPGHPYTDRLLRSDPHGAASGSLLPAIPGSVPAPNLWPQGCRFADRCPLVSDECRSGPVAMVVTEAGHGARCIHTDQLEVAQ